MNVWKISCSATHYSPIFSRIGAEKHSWPFAACILKLFHISMVTGWTEETTKKS